MSDKMREALVELRAAFVQAWGFEPGENNTLYRPVLDRVDAALAQATPSRPVTAGADLAKLQETVRQFRDCWHDAISEVWQRAAERENHDGSDLNLNGFDVVCDAVLALTPQDGGDEDWNIRKYIDFLRADEGDSVTLLCDNPDFNEQPNCAIECNGYWTNWQDRRFAADTLETALELAYFECRQWRENPPADASPDPLSPHEPVAGADIEARIGVLSDALKSISKNTCCDNCREAVNVARSALASYVGIARTPAPVTAGREGIALEIWRRFANPSTEEWDDETHKAEYLLCADAILALGPTVSPQDGRDAEIKRLREALQYVISEGDHVARWVLADRAKRALAAPALTRAERSEQEDK